MPDARRRRIDRDELGLTVAQHHHHQRRHEKQCGNSLAGIPQRLAKARSHPFEQMGRGPERDPQDQQKHIVPQLALNAAIASALARVCRAVTICRFSTILPSTTATPCPWRSASSKAAIWRLASSISAGEGEKDRVRDLELRGMDQRLAVEAHVAALLAFRAQALFVLEGIVDAVDDGEPMGAGRKQAEAQPRLHRQTVGPVAAAELLGEVVRAHHHAREARVGRDLGGVEHALRRLHHGPERQVGHEGRHRLQIRRPRDLGNEDRVRLCLREGLEIRPAPLGVHPVHPHDAEAMAVIGGLERGLQEPARVDLLVMGDGILEIEDDRIGGKALRLLQRPLLRAGNIEHGAEGMSLMRHDDSPPSNNLALGSTVSAYSASPDLPRRRNQATACQISRSEISSSAQVTMRKNSACGTICTSR